MSFRPCRTTVYKRIFKKYNPKVPYYCRICGKPTNNGADICQNCRKFIDKKRKEERTGKK
jgi:hypothetical protein